MSAKPALLLTRALPQSLEFADLCRDRIGAGIRIVISPVTRIELEPIKHDLRGFGAVIVTSVNGAAALPSGGNMHAFCVGTRSAAAARAKGYEPVIANGDVNSLLSVIRECQPTEPLLYPHGSERKTDIEAALEPDGIQVRSVVAYRQFAEKLTQEAIETLKGSAPVILPIFSAKSAHRLSDQLEIATAPIHLISISKAAIATWAGPKVETTNIAARPDAAHMLGMIATICNQSLS